MALTRKRRNGLTAVDCKRGTDSEVHAISFLIFISSFPLDARGMRGVGICPDRRAGTGAGGTKDVSLAKGANQFFYRREGKGGVCGDKAGVVIYRCIRLWAYIRYSNYTRSVS